MLREHRNAAGLTQEELAARAGLTARGISDLERGARKRPYPHTVRSLADAHGARGIGKTSLGIEAARRAAGSFPYGVAFVALAPMVDAALVLPTISQTLGLREEDAL